MIDHGTRGAVSARQGMGCPRESVAKSMVLRRIQIAATIIAAVFSVIAGFDVIVAALQRGPTAGGAMLNLPGASLALLVPPWSWLVLAGGLAVAPFCTVVSAVRSCHAARHGDTGALDGWRRITWGSSIVETTGCLAFVLLGTLLYLPSAVALLIAGVAELATILQDIEQHAPDHAAGRATT